jgi:hypothetical protein
VIVDELNTVECDRRQSQRRGGDRDNVGRALMYKEQGHPCEEELHDSAPVPRQLDEHQARHSVDRWPSISPITLKRTTSQD